MIEATREWFENFWTELEPSLRAALVSRGFEGDAVDQIVAAVKRHSEGMPAGISLSVASEVWEQVKLPIWNYGQEMLGHFMNALLDTEIELHQLRRQTHVRDAASRSERRVLQ